MPFDPHVIHPEEPPLDAAGELQLPDDLAELAAQLGEDSKFLARIYPAKIPGEEEVVAASASEPAKLQAECALETEPQAKHIKRSSRRLYRAVALVATLAALIASTPFWFSRHTVDDAAKLAANTEPAVAEPPATPDKLEPVAATTPVAEIRPEPPATAPPAPASREAFLQDYSGPELEGLYDLIGEEEEEKISI